MFTRNWILCALSFGFLVLSTPAAQAQDAFAGADNDPKPAARSLTMEELEKVAPLIEKMNAALAAGKVSDYAINAYKVANITGVSTYQLLADLATGDQDVESVDARELLEHKEILKKVYAARGKSDEDYLSFIESLEENALGGATVSESAQLRMQAAVDGKRALSGLRKLASSELRVYVRPPKNAQQIALRQCVKRACEQICAATHDALKLKFTKEDDANVVIQYEDREQLWYTYQTHSTSIITEPIEKGNINYVRLKVPMLATRHRYATEWESQEYCMREIPRALGLVWHPTSHERFTYDFKDTIASISSRSLRANDREIGLMTGAARLRALVQNAMESYDHAFEYYAGLAYLERGDAAMARRMLVASSPWLMGDPVLLHSAINRLVNSGDALGAELVAMACINDDPDNDENSPATKEYNRLRSHSDGSTPAGLPKLAATECELLAKIYEAPHVVSSK